MYGKDYMCDKCGDVLMKCLACGGVFCLNCDGDKENDTCPSCGDDEIVAADIEDIVYEEDPDEYEN